MTSPLKLVLPPTIDEERKSGIVDMAKRVLVMAEAGEIETLIILCDRVEGGWSDEVSGTTSYPRAIGQLEIMKAKWIADYLAGANHIAPAP